MSSGMGIYILDVYGLDRSMDAGTMLQVFIAYLVIGIPASYMQMVLGQFAHMGVFVLKRMVPIADGAGFSYCITIYFGSILAVLHTTVYLLYIMIAFVPGPLQWSVCGSKPNCWEVNRPCNQSTGCISLSVYISAFVFWNTTVVAGMPKTEDRRLDTPLGESVLLSLSIWIVIYLLSLVPILRLKIIVCAFTTVHLLVKAVAAIVFAIEAGPVRVFIYFTEKSIGNLLNITAWREAVQRVVVTMTLGDFSHIMVGALSGDFVKTGTVSFLSGILSFMSMFLTDLVVNGASMVLCRQVNISLDDRFLLFRPTYAPTILTVMPTIFELLHLRSLWNVIFFGNITIAILLRVILNINFLLEAISHRFPMLATYKKYLTPMVCFLSWVIGISLQGNSAHEIRDNFADVTIYFCQYFNVFLFATVVSYIYGVRRFCDDIHFLQKSPPNLYWMTTWTLLPILLAFNIRVEYLTRNNIFFKERIIEICIMFSPYVILTTFEIIKKIIERKTITLITPEAKWGPREVDRRLKRRLFNPRKQTRYMRGHLQCHHQCLSHNKTIIDLVTKEAEVMSRLGGVKSHKTNRSHTSVTSNKTN